jgi:hypothetical protein
VAQRVRRHTLGEAGCLPRPLELPRSEVDEVVGASCRSGEEEASIESGREPCERHLRPCGQRHGPERAARLRGRLRSARGVERAANVEHAFGRVDVAALKREELGRRCCKCGRSVA